ncbi:MAG: hypothetical protein WDW38_010656 [Sanguina aurantia]
MVYGVLQSHFRQWGGEEEVFKYSLFLVLFNRLSSCIIAVCMLAANGKWSEVRPVAPMYTYALVSLSNVIATTCQYEALKYVSFPVQTLGKCAKMLPVLVWGIIILGKKHTVKDFMVAIGITMGCTVFMLTGDIASKAATVGVWEASMYGLLLMLGYLGFDGFTSTFQDKLFKGYHMTTYNQILYTTLWSSLLSLTGAKVSLKAALWSIMSLSAAASIGALFISYTIKTFGSLAFATIMTTRQFLSILLSCLYFVHPLSSGQWLGTCMVFGLLYFQSFGKKDSKHGKSDPKEGAEKDAEKGSGQGEGAPLLNPDSSLKP